jgi:uncharacterized membrane protein YccF (DUF307 family)
VLEGEQMTKMVIVTKQNPGCLVQLLWFALIGWWAGELWIAAAWILMLTVVGAPLAVAMLNKLPQVIALRGQTTGVQVTQVGNLQYEIRDARIPQHSVFLRAIYFVLVGWWFSAVWMEVAYALCLSIIGLPIGFWMFDRVPALVSLRR